MSWKWWRQRVESLSPRHYERRIWMLNYELEVAKGDWKTAGEYATRNLVVLRGRGRY